MGNYRSYRKWQENHESKYIATWLPWLMSLEICLFVVYISNILNVKMFNVGWFFFQTGLLPLHIGVFDCVWDTLDSHRSVEDRQDVAQHWGDIEDQVREQSWNCALCCTGSAVKEFRWWRWFCVFVSPATLLPRTWNEGKKFTQHTRCSC